MGRGDIRTRKGKISAKSFGNRRPHHHKRKNKGAPERAAAHGAPASPDKPRR